MKLASKLNELYNNVKVPKQLFHIDFEYLDKKLREFRIIVHLCIVCTVLTIALCVATYFIH